MVLHPLIVLHPLHPAALITTVLSRRQTSQRCTSANIWLRWAQIVLWASGLSPDVEAAEDGEEEPGDDGHWNSQEHRHDPVDPDPAHLKQGVAPDPHPVPATHWHRLSNHVLERHLEKTPSHSGADAADQSSPSSTLLLSPKLCLTAEKNPQILFFQHEIDEF